MMIAERLEAITRGLPEGVRLVAVSKFHPVEAIREAYLAGQRVFGESKVQEMDAKHALLPEDIVWHFIGHLQTNKVKYIVPYVRLIHSVDSYKLLLEVERQAAKVPRVVDCLLQLHVAREETKFGFTPDELREMLAKGAWRELKHARVVGLMGMASNTDDTEQIRREFRLLHDLFGEVKARWFATDDAFKELSMGMSHDYPEALAAGSTMIRVGSKIFGERVY
ncbi:MAG: YggS family pyridoxal phosphate-dependent enzyme [Prevotellaceae bacterium]|nr:YggS family pyridoxal phosphate-dependent enzyme [Prevotellaceae bacterium]